MWEFANPVRLIWDSPDGVLCKTSTLNTIDSISTKLLHKLSANGIVMFYIRISNQSMEPNIKKMDILMVNRSVLPKVGRIVVADVNGEVIIKRLSKVDGQMTLTADNPNYPDVKVGDFDESMIWGVVTNVIHQLWRLLKVHQKSDAYWNCGESANPSHYVN